VGPEEEQEIDTQDDQNTTCDQCDGMTIRTEPLLHPTSENVSDTGMHEFRDRTTECHPPTRGATMPDRGRQHRSVHQSGLN